MRLREENCNMILLATVTLVSTMVAAIASWWQAPPSAATRPPVSIANQTVADQTEIRVVGAPFVPNINPRDR
jgi:ABC-type phosphate transport system substrate-binding protein